MRVEVSSGAHGDGDGSGRIAVSLERSVVVVSVMVMERRLGRMATLTTSERLWLQSGRMFAMTYKLSGFNLCFGFDRSAHHCWCLETVLCINVVPCIQFLNQQQRGRIVCL